MILHDPILHQLKIFHGIFIIKQRWQEALKEKGGLFDRLKQSGNFLVNYGSSAIKKTILGNVADSHDTLEGLEILFTLYIDGPAGSMHSSHKGLYVFNLFVALPDLGVWSAQDDFRIVPILL